MLTAQLVTEGPRWLGLAFAEQVSLRLGWGRFAQDGDVKMVWGGAEAQINVRTEHQPATRSFLRWELSSASQPGSLFPSSRVLLSAVLGTTEESHNLIHAGLLDGCSSLGRWLHPPYRQ